MKCALCPEQREADKKNTHYLTDAIIRGNLNEDGGNDRSKGSYWDLSTSKAFPEYGFQQATTQKTLLEVLGREPTQEEIDKAMGTPIFSADNIFCTQCEKWFGTIETPFIENILPCFKGKDLSKVVAYNFKDSSTIRSFFLLQIWRSAMCHQKFRLSKDVAEKMREALLSGNSELLKKFYLSITYLQTPTGDTSNFVGFAENAPYQIIFMNDFVVQFYESEKAIVFESLYGINDKIENTPFINYNEVRFKVKIIPDSKRQPIVKHIAGVMAQQKLTLWTHKFAELWKKNTGSYPTMEQTIRFRMELTNWDHLPIQERSSEQRVTKFTIDFIKSNIK